MRVLLVPSSNNCGANSRYGAVVGFIYLVSLALCALDIDTLMADELGQPLGTLFAQVLGVKTGIAFMAINAYCQMACGIAFVSLPSGAIIILSNRRS